MNGEDDGTPTKTFPQDYDGEHVDPVHRVGATVATEEPAKRPLIQTFDVPIDESGADEVEAKRAERVSMDEAIASMGYEKYWDIRRLQDIGFGFVPLRSETKTPPVGVIKGKATWAQAIATTNIVKTLGNPGTKNAAMTPPPGVVGLDADKGWATLRAEKERALGPLPVTLKVVSPHGEHLFYRWPESLPEPHGLWWGQVVARWDFRTTDHDGGYTVAPGSHVPDGGYTVYVDLDHDQFAIADLPEAWARDVLAGSVAPAAAGEPLAEVRPHYELPETVPEGGRYSAIRDYTAHLYNRGFSVEEMWAQVRSTLASRFAVAYPFGELRASFDRAVEGMPERLGPALSVVEPTAAVDVGVLDARLSGARVDASLAVRPVDADDDIVEDFIKRRSIVVLASEEGLGKSFARVELGLRIAFGSGDFLGAYHVNGEGKVVVVDEENGPVIEFDREEEVLAALGESRSSLSGRYIRYEYLLTSLVTPDGQALLKRLCEVEQPRLLVLDTGTGMVVSEWGEEMKVVMRFLRSLTNDFDCSVLVVVHMTKPLREGKGTSLTPRRVTEVMGHWTRQSDAVAVMSPAKQDGRVYWQVMKRVRRRPVYVLEARGGLWVKVEEVTSRVAQALKGATKVPAERAEKVLRDINDDVRAIDYEKRYGVSRTQYFNDLKALDEAGLLDRSGGQRTLTEAGLAVIGRGDEEDEE